MADNVMVKEADGLVYGLKDSMENTPSRLPQGIVQPSQSTAGSGNGSLNRQPLNDRIQR